MGKGTQRGEGNVKTEVEIGVMRPRSRDAVRRQGTDSPLKPLEEARLGWCLDFSPVKLILDFCPPE